MTSVSEDIFFNVWTFHEVQLSNPQLQAVALKTGRNLKALDMGLNKLTNSPSKLSQKKKLPNPTKVT